MNSKINISDFVIELPQVKFNPDDFLKLYDKDYKFQIYTSSHGNVSPQEVSYDKKLLEEPIVKHYLNVFKDFKMNFNYIDADKGTGFAGYNLVCGDYTNAGLLRHVDTYRNASITFPLSWPQAINFHTSPINSNKRIDNWFTDIVLTYEYPSSIVILNTGIHAHSVSPTTKPRLQFQFDCYNTWDEIKELVKSL
tara:strand:+ start:186 stop:767 length:582 start_codon:yes stop_codon:yes gene_type:complete